MKMFILATTDLNNVTTSRSFDTMEQAYHRAMRGNYKSVRIINAITNKTEFSVKN